MNKKIQNKPFISVIMSVYKPNEGYLREAIESILNQSFKEFEFIIIIDGPDKFALSIINSYIDGRIKVHQNLENIGLTKSLNIGLQLAKGGYIARMDADDIAFPNRLELQLNYVRKHPNISILGGYAIDINREGETITERKVPTSHQQIKKLVWTNPFIHGTVLLNRKAILEVGSYSQKLPKRQDYQLWFRCAKAGLQFANLPTPLIYYRFTDSTLQRNNWKIALTHIAVGWRGCWMIKAAPFAYLAVTKQLVIVLLPSPLRYFAYHWLKKFDPRIQN